MPPCIQNRQGCGCTSGPPSHSTPTCPCATTPDSITLTLANLEDYLPYSADWVTTITYSGGQWNSEDYTYNGFGDPFFDTPGFWRLGCDASGYILIGHYGTGGVSIGQTGLNFGFNLTGGSCSPFYAPNTSFTLTLSPPATAVMTA